MAKGMLSPCAKISMVTQIVSDSSMIQDGHEAAKAWITESYGITQEDINACLGWMNEIQEPQTMLWRWW